MERQHLGGVGRWPVRYYAMLAKATVHHFQGNNNELGTACGKCAIRGGCCEWLDKVSF